MNVVRSAIEPAAPGKSPRKIVLSACCQMDRISSDRDGFKRCETREPNLLNTTTSDASPRDAGRFPSVIDRFDSRRLHNNLSYLGTVFRFLPTRYPNARRARAASRHRGGHAERGGRSASSSRSWRVPWASETSGGCESRAPLPSTPDKRPRLRSALTSSGSGIFPLPRRRRPRYQGSASSQIGSRAGVGRGRAGKIGRRVASR